MQSDNSSQYSGRITIFIEIHAKEGEEEYARNTFLLAIEKTEKPGLLSYEIFEDSKNKGTFYSTQEWENLEAFYAHMKAVDNGAGDATSMLREPPRVSILRRIGQSSLQ